MLALTDATGLEDNGRAQLTRFVPDFQQEPWTERGIFQQTKVFFSSERFPGIFQRTTSFFNHDQATRARLKVPKPKQSANSLNLSLCLSVDDG